LLIDAGLSAMKFAFCIFKYYPYGGLEKSFLNILREAIIRGHNVTIYTRQWQGDVPAGAKVEIISASGLSNHAKCKNFANKLTHVLAAEEYNLVVGFNRMPGLDLYYCGDVSFMAKSAANHSALYRLSSRYRIFSQFEKSVFSRDSKTHILTIADLAQREYQAIHHTADQRFHAVPAGIDRSGIDDSMAKVDELNVRQHLGVAGDDFVLLMIGSDYQRKGVERSLRAVAAMENRRQLKLVIIGKGDTEKYQRLAAALTITEQVVFLGPREDRFDYLAAADVVLHPALSETAGNVILEGLIAGKPVIVTASCGFASHVERADAGCIIPMPYQQIDFNDRLEQALDREQLSRWQHNALTYAGREDLYSRPQKAVDIAEQLAVAKGTAS
jgi:UDP-glucose:(heptosyl)LPS alpha-1,3-glucosyltransferase